MFMNIRDLIYIRAVSKLKHFGKAAEVCGVSQPALSTQIKKLEQELGITLFERDSRSVQITDIGQDIIQLADEALSVIDNIRATAEEARDPFSGQFRLGAIPTIAPYLLPYFIKKNYDAFPKLKLHFQEDITERLNQALLNGELDAAILATPSENPKLDVIRLYDEPFWAVLPTGHSLQTIDKIRTEHLPFEELLLLTEGHCFRDQALDLCQLSATLGTRSIRVTSLETLINMVAAGQGITLVPAMALSGSWTTDQGVFTKKLDDPNAYRRIYLTFRKRFPRRQLLENMADLICTNLPSSVQRIAH
ncbi:MAG: LysR family transcriptional regulator [Robiginitomaculum sp.]|nr:MAG: LysR family transcriptional regulator [Robiginitomaculum sp.]